MKQKLFGFLRSCTSADGRSWFLAFLFLGLFLFIFCLDGKSVRKAFVRLVYYRSDKVRISCDIQNNLKLVGRNIEELITEGHETRLIMGGTNGLLSGSQIFAMLLDHKEAFRTELYYPNLASNRIVYDCLGSEIHCKIGELDENVKITLWSNGFDRRNDDGHGDDIVQVVEFETPDKRTEKN